MRDVGELLPEDAGRYRGDGWAPWFAVFVSVVVTGRSLVHVFRDDGGAASIAGIDLEVEGGRNIVSMFAQWGLEQLLLAGIAWLALARYRGLIPLVLLINLLDSIGRIAVGRAKPLQVEKPPPGRTARGLRSRRWGLRCGARCRPSRRAPLRNRPPRKGPFLRPR